MSPIVADLDARVRLRAFQYLEEQASIHGDALPRVVLERGFDFEGTRVPLLGPQGIFKPSVLDVPLSFTTVPVIEGRPRPYEDQIGADGLICYRYRGADPMHRDNVGLRLAMQRRTPLVYFYGLVAGRYAAVWPAYVVADDPAALTFSVEVGEPDRVVSTSGEWSDHAGEPRRAYLTVSVQRRLHQASFRHRVLHAYRQCCSVCRLKHNELLDAAHIVPDNDPRGEPWVSNGLALCKLHHAAFEANILGIRPDLIMEVRSDIMSEEDGPMLIHGIQKCHRQPLVIVPASPRLRPKTDLLEIRYEEFRRAVGV